MTMTHITYRRNKVGLSKLMMVSLDNYVAILEPLMLAMSRGVLNKPDPTMPNVLHIPENVVAAIKVYASDPGIVNLHKILLALFTPGDAPHYKIVNHYLLACPVARYMMLSAIKNVDGEAVFREVPQLTSGFSKMLYWIHATFVLELHADKWAGATPLYGADFGA